MVQKVAQNGDKLPNLAALMAMLKFEPRSAAFKADGIPMYHLAHSASGFGHTNILGLASLLCSLSLKNKEQLVFFVITYPFLFPTKKLGKWCTFIR